MKWYIETVDRDGRLHVWYRHGELHDVEDQLWLDMPDHVVVDCVPIDNQLADEVKELDFDMD